MARYFIEVSHEDDKTACLKAIQIFLQTGSHYLTHADWGCRDGEHKAWITIEAENKEDARRVLPIPFRDRAKIVGLSKFSLDQVQELLSQPPV